jgi:AraC-like DNA-binding protein
MQRGLLLESALQFGHAAHRVFHRQHQLTADSRCSFEPAFALDGWAAEAAVSPIDAFRHWARRYVRRFRAAHPLACALGARRLLSTAPDSRIVPSALARQVGCSTVHLQRTFKELTGRTLREYQDDIRLREAVRLLEQTDVKIEAIAIDLGYRSKKDFYRFVRTRLARTPGDVRDQAMCRRDLRARRG